MHRSVEVEPGRAGAEQKKPGRLGPAIVRFAVSGLLVLVVLRAVDPGRLLGDLGKLEAGRLVLILLVSWGSQLFCVQRWRLFAEALGMTGSYHRFARIYFAGMFFNVGLPSLVGGDVVKAYLAARISGSPLQRGLASVLQDRAAGLISLLAYGSLAAFMGDLEWRGMPIGLLYVLTWLGLALALWLAWKAESLSARLPGTPLSLRLRKAADLAADFHRSLVDMRLSAAGIAQVVVCSLVNSAVSLWLLQQVGAAARHPLPLVGFSALLPLITLATLLPITVGGVGIREWAYVEALALLGVPAPAALLVALTTSALLVVSDLAGALFLPTVPRGRGDDLQEV